MSLDAIVIEVAVPLLAFAIPVEVAAPIAVLASVIVASIVVAQDFRHIQLRSAARLILSTLLGLPLGLFLLETVPSSVGRGGRRSTRQVSAPNERMSVRLARQEPHGV
ncbi:MAG: hypothetical protein ACYCWW_07630 [Deltaproteobacteria bacterium]